MSKYIDRAALFNSLSGAKTVDKRVFVREDNYCGRAERRTDE